jgi:hypothetical protein
MIRCQFQIDGVFMPGLQTHCHAHGAQSARSGRSPAHPRVPRPRQAEELRAVALTVAAKHTADPLRARAAADRARAAADPLAELASGRGEDAGELPPQARAPALCRAPALRSCALTSYRPLSYPTSDYTLTLTDDLSRAGPGSKRRQGCQAC